MTRTQPNSGASIAAPAWELVALTVLVFFHLVAEDLFGREAVWLRNFYGSIALLVIMMAGATRMVLAQSAAIWTTLFWFRMSSGLYLGLGSLSPLIVPGDVRVYMENFFHFSDQDICEVNLLFACSVLTVLIASNLFLASGLSVLHVRGSHAERPQAMLIAAVIFLVLGAPVKYLLIVPSMLNLSDFVVPGSFALLGHFTYPALFFLTAYSLEQNRKLLPAAVLLLGVEMFIGLLGMTKQGVLTPLMIFLLAFMRRQVTVRRLTAMMATIAFVFVYIVPIVIDGRIELGNRYGTDLKAGFSERLEVMWRAAMGDLKTGTEGVSSLDITLVRLSYVNQAGFAMHLYDEGRGEATLGNAFAAFIPRFLWPDKPIMTSIGKEFNMLARGIDTSSSSPTIPGEAYWNFGWWGLLLVMAPMGVLFAVMSRYAIDVFTSGQWIYFPVVIMGIGIGHRIDGHIVSDLIGLPVIFFCLHLVLNAAAHGLRFMNPAMNRRAQPATSRSAGRLK